MYYYYDSRAYNKITNTPKVDRVISYELITEFSEGGRTEFNILLNQVKTTDTIIIPDLRLLGNNSLDALNMIRQINEKCNILCLKPSFDTRNKFGEMYLEAINWYLDINTGVVEDEDKLGQNFLEHSLSAMKLKEEIGEKIEAVYKYANWYNLKEAKIEAGKHSKMITWGTIKVLQYLELKDMFSSYKFINKSGQIRYDYKELDKGKETVRLTCNINQSNCRCVIREDGSVFIYSLSIIAPIDKVSVSLRKKAQDIRKELQIDEDNQLLEPVVFEDMYIATQVLIGASVNPKVIWRKVT